MPVDRTRVVGVDAATQRDLDQMFDREDELEESSPPCPFQVGDEVWIDSMPGGVVSIGEDELWMFREPQKIAGVRFVSTSDHPMWMLEFEREIKYIITNFNVRMKDD